MYGACLLIRTWSCIYPALLLETIAAVSNSDRHFGEVGWIPDYVRTRLTQSNLSMRMQMCVHGVFLADHALCMVLAYLYVRGLVYTQSSSSKCLPPFRTVTDILGR